MFEEIEVITYEDYQEDVYEKKYGMLYGSSMLEITKELMEDLKRGLVVACNNGEYCTFVMIKKGDK